ncbi:MAG: helix-turn-helix transcriptional regulator [Rhodobiaceae bacterium]|nr:helix-turn-helix transcriptional regulator [Rhodobiaceae bacterium]
MRISKNILSRRLSKMEADGLLARRPSKADARSHEYRLTDKGRDLFAIPVAMTQWSDRWEDRGNGPPIVLRYQDDGSAVGKVEVRVSNSRKLDSGSIYPSPGSGADEVTRRRFSGPS